MKNNENPKNKKNKKAQEKEKEKEKIKEIDESQQSSIIYNKDSTKINIYPHLRQNILEPGKNCKDSLAQAYYCIDCKCSTCEKCSLKNHQGHKLIFKNDYMNFDKSTLEETKRLIKESNIFENKKDNAIKMMESQASILHAKIDEIKEKKINEIKNSYITARNNIKELINFVDNVEQIIDNFYTNNKRFFNEKKNNDQNNTIFLIKYEFMTLCNNKNKEILKGVNQLKKEYDNYADSIKDHADKVIQEINNFLGCNKPRDKLDDYYWDVKFRVKTYDEHINKVQKGIYDILSQTGDINDLKDIVNVLDSKNKKGIQYIFNQDYFNSPKTESQMQEGSVSLQNSNIKVKQQKELNLTTKDNLNTPKITHENKKKNYNIRLNRFNSPSKNINRSSSALNSPSVKTTISRCESATRTRGNKKFGSPNLNHYKRTAFNEDIKYVLKRLGIKSYNDVILDDKVKQKYFAYSIIDLYNRLFINQARKSFDNNARIFADYNERNSKLKEYIKPIIGTNEVIIYNPTIDKSKKIKLPLNKRNHGYDKFPVGCRHLYIENKVYICGGVNELNMPISICLVLNAITNTIQRIDDMIVPRAYHSMEFLDNYDCFLVMGGEYNKSVEIFDIFTNKWRRLPDLNVPRANLNIYFDEFTSELYALFGMLGTVSQKHINNSETIEVLELNDISSGWCKVDYYKGSSFDLRNELVTTLPFTRNKILIYGGKNVRDGGKLFGLFLIDRMEVIKADKEVIEKIKCEQKRIKLLNNAYTKTTSV